MAVVSNKTSLSSYAGGALPVVVDVVVVVAVVVVDVDADAPV